jgi:hypothetical protein
MLNGQNKQVMDVLRALTGEDGIFKVLEADEILEKLPADSGMTKVQLSAVIRDLRDREYLKVKYFTPDEYCLLTLRRAEEIQQLVEEVTAVASAAAEAQESIVAPAYTVSKPRVEGAAPKVKKATPLKRGIIFFYSFLGALLGGGIAAAAAILLQKFLIV